MGVHRRLEVSDIGPVCVVRFTDSRIVDPNVIEEMGDELYALVEQEQRLKLLLNFTGVDFLSSATLNKLIHLDRKVRAAKGQMKISNLRPELREVMTITRLDKLFDVRAEQADALAAFAG